jgi:hypothetical protein
MPYPVQPDRKATKVRLDPLASLDPPAHKAHKEMSDRLDLPAPLAPLGPSAHKVHKAHKEIPDPLELRVQKDRKGPRAPPVLASQPMATDLLAT